MLGEPLVTGSRIIDFEPPERRGATPEAVKASVMRFFEGVDVDTPGVHKKGFIDLLVRKNDKPYNFSPYVVAEASVHGKKVATYSRYSQPSLSNGVIASYQLVGEAKLYGEQEEISVGAYEREDGTSSVSFCPLDVDAVNTASKWIETPAE